MNKNFFSIKTKDPEQVEQIKKQKSGVIINNLNILSDKIQLNDFVFVVFGGDKPTNWTPGLVALGHVSKLPYDFVGKNFSVNLDIDLYFEPITRKDLIPFPDTYGIIGIAPIVKWEPNQALSQVSTEKVKPLLQAILELRDEFKERIIQIIGNDLLKELSEAELHRFIKVKSKLFSNDFTITSDKSSNSDCALQIIYYGAPGTGKSHRIKEQLEGVSKANIFRTTFHPDSDYSTFVGAYKPTSSKRPLYGLFGKETVRLRDGKDLSEETITYKFIPQAFLNAYMQAYKKPEEKVYLIIEEINRGNCAQIFGDLFQLLDRDANGVSEYTIKADADLKAFLEDEMGKDSDAIKEGELCLPSNLYIYATMNTSDQSLFPIDSAFKRRWDWEYEPIKYKNTDWVIEIQDKKYSWVSFQKEVNKRIFVATNSEDKMLGDYFVNPNDGRITEKMLLNKILFYLWNDVCKDGEGDIFKVSDTEDVSFSELYGTNGAQKLIDMMEYLGVELIREDSEDNEDSEDDNENDNDKNNSQYSINGEKTNEKGKAWGKGALVKRAVEIYCQNYPNLSANEIRDIWINTGFRIPHIVETEEDKQKRLYGSKDKTGRERCKPIELKNGETLYVSTEVGSDKVYNNFEDFLLKIKSKPEWGINIQEL